MDSSVFDMAAHAKVESVDVASVAEGIRTVRHPLVPVLRALQHSYLPKHGEWLQCGATARDMFDTGTALQLREAHPIFRRDLAAAVFDRTTCVGLAPRTVHRLLERMRSSGGPER